MNIATIKQKVDGNWYCSNCMMGQHNLRETCFFCGSLFSNYEVVLMEIKQAEFEYETENNIKDSKMMKLFPELEDEGNAKE